MAENTNHGQGAVKDPGHDHRLKGNGGGQQGQGEVKDPKHDHRLKENRSPEDDAHDRRHQDHGQGDVKDPEHDRRLKQNK